MKAESNHITSVIAAIALFGLAASAHAYQWDFESTACGGSCIKQVSANKWQITASDGSGQVITATAYATTNQSTAYNTAPPTNSPFTSNNVQLNYYSGGGFGIDNNTDPNDGSSPEHAIDNNQLFDLIVFDFGQTNMDLKSFELGWATETYSGSSTYTGAADVSLFAGGGFNPITFEGTCFTGCGATKSLDALGFQQVNLNNVGDGSLAYTDGTSGSPNIGPGRYLVVSGSLTGGNDGGFNDDIKINKINASCGTGGCGKVPEPGTLALIGLGLAGFGGLKRKRTVRQES